MWAAAEEPPGTMEGGPPEQPDPEASDQQKTQLETFQEIMTRNKQSLKKKEQEAQVNFQLVNSTIQNCNQPLFNWRFEF